MLCLIVPRLRDHGVSFKIAKDSGILSALNSGELGETQVGKFMTIYPSSDDDAVLLAEALIKATTTFSGPSIPTDAYLGGVVYTRYGGFNPLSYMTRLGQRHRAIEGPDGTLIPDEYRVPFTAPPSVTNPFAGFIKPPSIDGTALSRFGPGFRVIDVLRARSTGSTFLVIDLRSRDDLGLKVLKQARPFCFSDDWGRDARSRLRHQEAAHRRLAHLGVAPRCGDYFEVNGLGYLPLDYIEGQSIEKVAVEALAARPWTGAAPDVREQLLDYGLQLIRAVRAIHHEGWVHRDVAANNVWIADHRVYMLDFELSCDLSAHEPPFFLGTPGFMSPNQEARGTPSYEDDVYATGCLFILLLTGVDPRRLSFGGENAVAARLASWMAIRQNQALQAIGRCVASAPEARPDLGEVEEAIEAERDLLCNAPSIPLRRPSMRDLDNVPRKSVYGLIHEVATDGPTGLPLSAVEGEGGAPTGSFQLSRYAHRGAAGLLYALARVTRCGCAVDHDRASRLVEWLVGTVPGEEPLPGLFFGAAGIAASLAEAIVSGLVPPSVGLDDWILTALSAEPDWPDLTHGAAGQGTAALYCAEILGRPDLARLAGPFADFLIQTQNPDGSWSMPDGVPGMSGERLTGLAHGAAGIAMFLAEYAARNGGGRAGESCRKAIDWLMDKRLPGSVPVAWPYSDRNSSVWKWWCHGAPGIALALLRIGDRLDIPECTKVAINALAAHPPDVRWANLSQCHGLAGLGEIYLEAWRMLGDPEWFDRAAHIASLLLQLRREDRGLTWIVENPATPTADLMIGAAGIVHFLLRFAGKFGDLGPPLLLPTHLQAADCP